MTRGKALFINLEDLIWMLCNFHTDGWLVKRSLVVWKLATVSWFCRRSLYTYHFRVIVLYSRTIWNGEPSVPSCLIQNISDRLQKCARPESSAQFLLSYYPCTEGCEPDKETDLNSDLNSTCKISTSIKTWTK